MLHKCLWLIWKLTKAGRVVTTAATTDAMFPVVVLMIMFSLGDFIAHGSVLKLTALSIDRRSLLLVHYDILVLTTSIL